MESHYLAGLLRPLFWLLVMLPFLAGLRWLLLRYVRPHLKERTWFITQKPVNDVHAAIAIVAGIVLAGLLIGR